MRSPSASPRRGKDDFKQTPKYLLKQIRSLIGPFFDPCPVNPKFDGLAIDWKDVNYANPPYSQKAKWIKKAIRQMICNRHFTAMLLPVDTSTKWFLDLVYPNASIIWIRGRVHYDDGTYAMHASMLAVFHDNYFGGLPDILEQKFAT